MTWLWYSLSSMIFFTLYNLVSQKMAYNSKNPVAFSAVYYFIAAFICLPLFIIEPFRWQNPSLFIILMTVLSFFVWAFFGRFEYIAKKYIEVSVFHIIVRLAPAISFILATIFLGETLTIKKVVALCLILVANFAVLSGNINLRMGKGILYAFGVAFTLGLGWIIDKVVSPYYSLPLYSWYTFIAPAIFNLTTPPIPKKVLKQEFQIASWWMIILGIFNVVGYYLMLRAYAYGEASKVTLVSTSSSIITIILGIILFHERERIPQKLTAGLLIALSIILLT